ncbi:uncharacterized protein LOC119766046 [Culex quinquefasciatus]|uniref:uncharacterized protein LOC119766046 n=1 Tax=Culex quinquefasciatus TaxID=7176 RepID=UPI0018E2FBBA|nr:uncharacterized protein LOC119766046 [Culex quinquefasciatus]
MPCTNMHCVDRFYSQKKRVSNRVVFFQVHIKFLETTRDGMKIEARHVRRKKLNKYLDPNLLKRERKNQRLLRRRKCANDLLRRNCTRRNVDLATEGGGRGMKISLRPGSRRPLLQPGRSAIRSDAQQWSSSGARSTGSVFVGWRKVTEATT